MKMFESIRSELIPDFISKLKLGDLVNEEVLLSVTSKHLKNNKFNDAALMIVRYKFQPHFDLKFIMMRLVDPNKIETAKMMLANDDELKAELIRSLSTNDNCKKAAQLIKDFHLNEADFPEVKERIMKKGVRYYLGRNLNQKKNHKEFLSLDRIEDLLSGFKQMLAYLVEDLTFNKRINEAIGIMTRNQVESYVRTEVKQKMSEHEYDQTKDTSLFLYDEFEPLSKPAEEYISLQEHLKLEWIETEDDV